MQGPVSTHHEVKRNHPDAHRQQVPDSFLRVPPAAAVAVAVHHDRQLAVAPLQGAVLRGHGGVVAALQLGAALVRLQRGVAGHGGRWTLVGAAGASAAAAHAPCLRRPAGSGDDTWPIKIDQLPLISTYMTSQSRPPRPKEYPPTRNLSAALAPAQSGTCCPQGFPEAAPASTCHAGACICSPPSGPRSPCLLSWPRRPPPAQQQRATRLFRRGAPPGDAAAPSRRVGRADGHTQFITTGRRAWTRVWRLKSSCALAEKAIRKTDA
jgi:hypothetical protein